MPLTRYLLRNEQSLAHPEIYTTADKDDPEALLEGVAMAGLVGVLRQLGDLAEFAAEIFHDLHEEVMATAARGHGLMARVQQLEADFPSIEKAFLKQTDHSPFFSNGGMDWHPNLHCEQNLIARGDLPRFVMDSYEESRGPPRLFLLDKYDVAGAGACLKRYTDPSFFKMEATSSGISTQIHREKRARKIKKKGMRWRNVGTPEVAPTTHAKLHQLLMEERIQNGHIDPARLVKLKKRQLNGSPVDAKTGKSYMEKFLETSLLDQEKVCETSTTPLPLKLIPDDSSESAVKILEISTVSPVKRATRNESVGSSTSEQEVAHRSSLDLDGPVDEDIVKVDKSLPDVKTDEIPSSPLETSLEREFTVDGKKNVECHLGGYQSDDLASEVDNYMDALATMESEIETDNENRPNRSSIGNHGADSDGYEEHLESQALFSDSQSIGNSSASDENNLFKKSASSVSCSDTSSSLLENTLLDGDGFRKFHSSVEACVAKDSPSDQLVIIESQEVECAESVKLSGRHNQKKILDNNEVHSRMTKSSLTDWHSDQRSTSLIAPVVDAQFDEAPCESTEQSSKLLDTAEDHVLLVESVAVVPDAPSLTWDNACPTISSHGITPTSNSDFGNALVKLVNMSQFSNAMESDSVNKCDDSSVNKMLVKESAEGNSAEALVEGNIGSPPYSYSADVQPKCTMADNDKTETECASPRMDNIVKNILPTTSFMDQISELTDGLPPQAKPDLVVPSDLYCGQQSYAEGISVKEKDGEAGESMSSLDAVGDDTPHKHPSDSTNNLPQDIHVVLEGMVAQKVQEADEVVPCSDGDRDDDDNITVPKSVLFSSSKSHASTDEGLSYLVDFQQKEEKLNEVLALEILPESKVANEVNVISSSTPDFTNLQESHRSFAVLPEKEMELHGETGTESLTESEVQREVHFLESTTGRSLPVGLSTLQKYDDANDLSLAVKAETNSLIDQQVKALDVSAPDSQESEPTYPSQSNALHHCEDIMASYLCNHPESAYKGEQLLLRDDQLHLASVQGDGHSDAAKLPSKHIASSNHLEQENCSPTASVSSPQTVLLHPAPSEASVQVGGEQFDHARHLKEPLQPFLPGVLPEATTQINLEEMPPMPPLPPMQWRMGKVQQASLDPQRKLVGLSQASFQLIQPSKTEEKGQIGLPVSDNGISQPENLPFSVTAVGGEKPQRASIFSVADTGHSFSVPIASQFPDVTNGACIQYNYLPLEGKQIQNPFLTSTTVSSENLPRAYIGLKDETEQHLKPLSPVLPVGSSTPGLDSVQSLEDKLLQPSSQLRHEGEIEELSCPLPPVDPVESSPMHESLPSQDQLIHPSSQFMEETSTNNKDIQQCQQNLEDNPGDATTSSMSTPSLENVQRRLTAMLSEGEMAWPPDTSSQTVASESEQPNGSSSNKLPRPRSPLVDAVAAHDKSKLRKVAERIRPQLAPKLDERDSLLEQIRAKSFSLKPAATTRPIVQGPKTNLKLAAILEKANAIRQALAGSDEDDDADSWE